MITGALIRSMKMNNSTTRQILILLLAALVLSGCTTTRTVDSTTGLTAQIQSGDHLIVYENSGRKLDMTLQSLANDRLTGMLSGNDGKTVEVLFTDIEKIEVKEIDRAKTAGVVIGTILGAALVIGLNEMPYPGFPL